MGIEDRLQKLEGEYPPPACEEQPCQSAAAFTVWDRREDGTLTLVRGKVPPTLVRGMPLPGGRQGAPRPGSAQCLRRAGR